MTANANDIELDRYDEIVAEIPALERTLPVMLRRRAEKYGDKPFVTCCGARWSFAETEQIAQVWASRLSAAGVKLGDRVAIHCSNRPEFLQMFLGCAYLGAIATPINTAFRGVQLAHVLNNSQPILLVMESQYSEIYAQLPDNAKLPNRVWTINADCIVDANGAVVHAPATSLPQEVFPQAKDPVAILYTSGTTGPSKGVICPQAQLFWWGIYSARALKLKEGDVLFTPLPVFHTNALNTFYQALLNGCEYVLQPKFSASRFWDQARECGATVTYLLGAMAAILLARKPGHEGTDKDHSIRIALGGGVPAATNKEFLDRFGVPLVDGYASTETNVVFFGPAPSDHPGTMGYLAKGADALIVNDDGVPVPDGQAGELLLRPTELYSFASGYFGMPEKTVEAWQNFWFHTGDRVVREADGHYRFVDRMKDSIRRRGENVSSWEVEEAISTHPAIDSCAAYPVPSELGEDEVAAAFLLKPGEDLDELDLIKHLEGRLAYFAIPRFLRKVDQMPMTENGKIKKVVLREEGIVDGMWKLDASGYELRR